MALRGRRPAGAGGVRARRGRDHRRAQWRAGGALLGMDGGPAGYISLDDNETPVFGTPDDGVVVHTEPRIWPTPDDAGRVRTLACLDVFHGRAGGGSCDGDADQVALIGACRQATMVGGLVGAGVAGVRLTLGSGAEVRLGVGDLPTPFGGRRALGAFVPAGEAVRSAAAVDAAGAVIARTKVGTPPGGQPCTGEDRGGDHFGGRLVPVSPPPGAVAVASAGGESLLVADQGETLCAGLGELGAGLCPSAPVDSERPRLLWRRGVVAGVLSRDAARVKVLVDRGRDVTVGTTDGAAYAGRWAGRVRFFAAAVGAHRHVVGAVVRNAAGRIIGISRRVLPRRRTATVLAERDGRGVRLVREEGRQPLPVRPERGLTALLHGPEPRYADRRAVLPYSAAVTVPCAPRLAFAYGRMPDRFAAPRVLLDGGGSVRAQRIRLRGEDGWVAFIPDARVRGLRAGDHGVPLDLPPASAQCVYTAERRF